MLDPRDVLEMLAYYESYGNEAPKEVKVADLISLSNECLRLRQSLEQISIVDKDSPEAALKMNKIANIGIGDVNLIMI